MKSLVIYFSRTHEGSGLGTSIDYIRKYCVDADIKECITICGSNVKNTIRKLCLEGRL